MSRFLVSWSYLMKLTSGRAPIDPNFVLAIERNQQHQTARYQGEDGQQEQTGQENGTVTTTIIDEYKEVALYDIFKGIVSQLISEEDSAVEA